MFAVFFAAGSLTLYAVSDGDVSTTVVILLGGVLIAITARQVLLLVDNDRLRASLEQRVIERSTELAEVTQRTDLLVDSVEDGVYGVDSQGRVTFVNPAGARLLGARRGALLGQYAHETFHSHPLADCYLRTIQRNGAGDHRDRRRVPQRRRTAGAGRGQRQPDVARAPVSAGWSWCSAT